MCVCMCVCVCVCTVEKNGDVCISILHEPGEDKWGYEKPEERWLPVHTVETILLSVISMLADPNDESPANVDAAVSGRSFSGVQIHLSLLTLSTHVQEGYSNRPVCLSVCHALILEITDN